MAEKLEEHSKYVDPATEGDFYTHLKDSNVEALWTVMSQMVPPRPNPSASVCLWSYKDLRPKLIAAGELTSAEEAERRVLMLVNPTMQAPCTTDTIYAGLQVILPGEIAPAHRHTAFALRFIVEGRNGFTSVEGQKVMMERGDVILTPSWHWHDHGNEGTGPMIWLDGLDLPLYKFLRNNFAEMYSKSTYPCSLVEDSKFKFPWQPVEKNLSAANGDYAIFYYRQPNGQHLSKTISAQAERINAGTTSPESQETCSFVYHVHGGCGFSTIILDQAEDAQRVYWEKGDSFSIPSWSMVTHTCSSKTGAAYLFAINDRPMLESLGSARKSWH